MLEIIIKCYNYMRTREEIKTEVERKGVNDFSILEALLDIRELLEKLKEKLKVENIIPEIDGDNINENELEKNNKK